MSFVFFSEKLWPYSSENNVVVGWFGVIKSLFQINNITDLTENEVLTLQDYLEVNWFSIFFAFHGMILFVRSSAVTYSHTYTRTQTQILLNVF